MYDTYLLSREAPNLGWTVGNPTGYGGIQAVSELGLPSEFTTATRVY